MPFAGLEPAPLTGLDFESNASTDFTKKALKFLKFYYRYIHLNCISMIC